MPTGTPCTRPPEGWWCPLELGHIGPCPTHPYYGTPLEVVLADYLSPSQIARVRADLESRITAEQAAKQVAAMERIHERNRRLFGSDAVPVLPTEPAWDGTVPNDDYGPWGGTEGCFGHCDPEGWYAKCRRPAPTEPEEKR